MGQHSLPQYYLSGFAPPGTTEVWMYEKGKDNPRLLPIKIVAQERQRYGDVEGFLTQDIERPANDVMKKIRNREAISAPEKLALSKYIFVFWKRVEAAFERFKEKSPEIARDGMQNLDARLREIEAENPDKAKQGDTI